MKDDDAIIELAKHTDEISKYFNEELLLALTELRYFEAYKFSNTYISNTHDYFVEGVSIDNFIGSVGGLGIDYLGLFLYLYGNTIDNEEIVK